MISELSKTNRIEPHPADQQICGQQSFDARSGTVLAVFQILRQRGHSHLPKMLILRQGRQFHIERAFLAKLVPGILARRIQGAVRPFAQCLQQPLEAAVPLC
jgi:hypothetical protein